MRVKINITEHERHRRAMGLSLTAMSRVAEHADHSYLSQIERGTTSASKRYRKIAARLLQVAEGELFDEDGFAR